MNRRISRLVYAFVIILAVIAVFGWVQTCAAVKTYSQIDSYKLQAKVKGETVWDKRIGGLRIVWSEQSADLGIVGVGR